MGDRGLAYAVFDGRATTLSLKHLGTESGGYYLGHTYFEANSQTSTVTYKNNNENDQCVFEHNKSTFKRTTGSTATGHPLVVIDHECAGVEAFSVKLISSSSDYNASEVDYGDVEHPVFAMVVNSVGRCSIIF